jgi:hypothetical protein
MIRIEKNSKGCECDRCGKTNLKRGYKVSSNPGLYGPECALILDGKKSTQKSIRKLTTAADIVDRMMANKKQYGWDDYKAAYNMDDSELANHFFTKYSN